MLLQDFYNVTEQVAPLRAVEAKLLASFRKWLAGESGAEDVVWWNLLVGGPDITNRLDAKIEFIDTRKLGIDLGRQDTLVAQANERLMEAAEASK